MPDLPDPLRWQAPWRAIEDDDERAGLQAQLEREVGRRHPLHGRGGTVVGRRIDNDDLVAVLPDGTFVNVHLAWVRPAWFGPRKAWPDWFAYGDADAFAAAMGEDARAYAADRPAT